MAATAASAPVYTQLYDDVTLRRHGDEDASSWDVDEVVAWLGRIGLAEHGKAFKKHKVTGPHLRSLSEAHLAELGLVIGDRLTLLAEAAKLSFLAAVILWEGDEVRSFHGPVDYAWKAHFRPCLRKITCQRPALYDHYELTNVALVVTESERGMLDDACCCGRAVKRTTRHIDLEHITSVTTNTASKDMRACDYGVADLITVELDKMKLLRPVQPIVVPQGDSAALVAKILDQVQKSRLLYQKPPLRSPSTMVRS